MLSRGEIVVTSEPRFPSQTLVTSTAGSSHMPLHQNVSWDFPQELLCHLTGNFLDYKWVSDPNLMFSYGTELPRLALIKNFLNFYVLTHLTQT